MIFKEVDEKISKTKLAGKFLKKSPKEFTFKKMPKKFQKEFGKDSKEISQRNCYENFRRISWRNCQNISKGIGQIISKKNAEKFLK